MGSAYGRNSRKNTSRRRASAAARRRRKKVIIFKLTLFTCAVIAVLVLLEIFVFSKTGGSSKLSAPVISEDEHETSVGVADTPLLVEPMLLTPNEYSRPGIALGEVNGIVIHYVGNANSTAKQNRNYFEGLKDGEKGTYASSHFIVGLEGEIVQCVPLDEIAYASNSRNSDTISIETCHINENGEYTTETYDSLVALTAWLCRSYNLTSDDVIRHYDVTGKICPKYFVDNEEAWEQFKTDVTSAIAGSSE